VSCRSPERSPALSTAPLTGTAGREGVEHHTASDPTVADGGRTSRTVRPEHVVVGGQGS
jgi:hypothetical protein